MNLLFWVPGAAGPREPLRWGAPTSIPRQARPRPGAGPEPPTLTRPRRATRALREPCKVLCWHLPLRDIFTSVPIFGQQLRPPTGMTSSGTTVRDGGRPPEGQRPPSKEPTETQKAQGDSLAAENDFAWYPESRNGQRAPSLGVGVHHVEARAEVGEGRPRPGRRTGIGKLSREPEAPETPTSEPAGTPLRRVAGGATSRPGFVLGLARGCRTELPAWPRVRQHRPAPQRIEMGP